jgi:hypothetical protein
MDKAWLWVGFQTDPQPEASGSSLPITGARVRGVRSVVTPKIPMWQAGLDRLRSDTQDPGSAKTRNA